MLHVHGVHVVHVVHAVHAVHAVHVVHAVHAVHAVNAARTWCTSSKPLKNYPNLLFPYCYLESGIKQICYAKSIHLTTNVYRN